MFFATPLLFLASCLSIIPAVGAVTTNSPPTSTATIPDSINHNPINNPTPTPPPPPPITPNPNFNPTNQSPNPLPHLDLIKRVLLTSTAIPASGCTLTKRIPKPARHAPSSSTTSTITSFVNCRGCVTATAVAVGYVPGRGAGPAWRRPPGQGANGEGGQEGKGGMVVQSVTGAVVYRCLGMPGEAGGRGHGGRTRPVEPTVIES
ncbi:hypothetical protein C8A05DRAFT_39175 [Staphylotrichum tortipilum]|uniref:Uncharacterized protein n=1 Tax=Staphylotrichum tortipilum TaxID=2831512 RepID=A0AAN6MA88_9PEZI|nr:hypothetical protein C8A05DRAFT_39175 [Staphylotrichum longicolle]